MSEQKKKLAYKFLNRFNDLEKVVKDVGIYYLDNNKKIMVYYSQDDEYRDIWISYDRIWSFFEEFFLMKYEEIQGILKDWLEEIYKIKGFTPIFSYEF